MRTITTVVGALLAIPLFALGAGCAQHNAVGRALTERRPPAGALHELQVIGTHNSYKLAIQPELMGVMRTVNRNAEGLDYQHLPLTDQLNLGLRGFELDVYWDPDGGRYADPLGNRLLRSQGIEPWPIDEPEAMAEPGFKVIHDADFDFRTRRVRLGDTLEELRRWSDANPGHIPIMVTMNTKQGRSGVPGSVEPAGFDGEALRRLDGVVARVLSGRLVTPDAVRRDDGTLLGDNGGPRWPDVGGAAGTFLFVLDQRGDLRERYLAEFPELRGATFFTLSGGAGYASGVDIINNPVRDGDRIRAFVEAGGIVRTRADVGTREARDEDSTRFEAAKASGAQVIFTDYPIPDRKRSDRFFVRFDDGGFVRTNPVTRPRD